MDKFIPVEEEQFTSRNVEPIQTVRDALISPFSSEADRLRFAQIYGGSLGVKQVVELVYPYWES